MSVFDGEIDFQSMYSRDYSKKDKPKSPRATVTDHNDLIVGLGRHPLKTRDVEEKVVDVLCPLKKEYYKETLKRIKEKEPRLAEIYLSKDLDPVPIEHDSQDLRRTEYLCKYCSRDLPFMSVNLARRARALQTLRLPDDVDIPATTVTNSYRAPHPDKYKNLLGKKGLNPKYGSSGSAALTAELRRILRVSTGESTYTFGHGILGQVLLENNPFGPPREEPRFGRWRTPHYYTYYMHC